MKYLQQITAAVFFALALSPVLTVQAAHKDKERAENERDLIVSINERRENRRAE